MGLMWRHPRWSTWQNGRGFWYTYYVHICPWLNPIIPSPSGNSAFNPHIRKSARMYPYIYTPLQDYKPQLVPTSASKPLCAFTFLRALLDPPHHHARKHSRGNSQPSASHQDWLTRSIQNILKRTQIHIRLGTRCYTGAANSSIRFWSKFIYQLMG